MARRFVADVMLARLARWLRMLGISVSPPRLQSDDEIIKQCVSSQAALVTRDVALAQKASDYSPCILLLSASLDRQLLEFCKATGFDLLAVKESRVPCSTICPECNGKLRKATKSSVKRIVPPKSWKNSREFWRCSSCGKIYWQGSHNKKILEGLRRMKKKFRRASRRTPSGFPPPKARGCRAPLGR